MSAQKTIGIVGGGQLGRMLTLAALPLGFRVVVVDPNEHCPAAQVGAAQIVGRLDDIEALQQLVKRADFITFEIEHFNTEVFSTISDAKIPVNPSLETIRLIQDKFLQKEFLKRNHIAVAPFVAVNSLEDAEAALQKFSGKMLLKTRHGAYDGRGNALIEHVKQLKSAMVQFKDKKLYAEAFVPFKKELAVMVARDTRGTIKTYPVTETIHKRNICVETITPAGISADAYQKAEALALQTAEHLEGAGVLGVEMFLTKDGDVLVNEIAPRVHNSGHYTMDACTTSQFEQHIRAITGLPLGETNLLVPAAVMINILGERNGDTEIMGLAKALAFSNTHVYVYGKSPTKIDRKMGHINVLGENIKQAQVRARKARGTISI